MQCKICSKQDAATNKLNNDCIVECLEKLKAHILHFENQVSESQLLIKSLKETNSQLEKNLLYYENNSNKKRRTAAGTSENREPELEISATFEIPNTADNLGEDFNIALNDTSEFQMSPSNHSSLLVEETQPVIVKREPMRTLQLNSPAKSDYVPNTNDASGQKKSIKSETLNKSRKNASWMSKENEVRRSTLGPPNNAKSFKSIKEEQKGQRLSLKSGRLRQTRLQLNITKDLSDGGDSTFCEEAIEASPQADTSIKRNKSWSLRNVSTKIDKHEAPSFARKTSPCREIDSPKIFKSPKAKENVLDSSSVVMLTPATQDIIFLDDSYDSSNIESMDLLRDLMNPSESLKNLRRLESNQIKSLQKTVGHMGIESHTKKCADVGEKKTNLEVNKKIDFASPKKPLDSHFEDKRNVKVSPAKFPDHAGGERTKNKRQWNIDCYECQAYIKHLGERLSDEQIERHIAGCTKHKTRFDMVNPTPDGFWDTSIKPLDENDRRNETLLDTRFVGINKRN